MNARRLLPELYIDPPRNGDGLWSLCVGPRRQPVCVKESEAEIKAAYQRLIDGEDEVGFSNEHPLGRVGGVWAYTKWSLEP